MWIDETTLSKQQIRKLNYILKDNIMSRIKVKLLNKDCMPERTHRWDAGWDLKAAETVTIPAGETCKVHTGVIFEIPARFFGMVVPRSSFGIKHRLTLANDVGVIDSEYRGEVLVFLSNDSDKDFVIDQGTRFAQILIIPVNPAELWKVDKVSKTGRGGGGFGSTTLTEGGTKGGTGSTKEQKANIKPIDKPPAPSEMLCTQPNYVTKELQEEVTTEDKRIAAVEELKKVTPVEYLKLQKSGMLFEAHPIATGDMKVDLCLK